MPSCDPLPPATCVSSDPGGCWSVPEAITYTKEATSTTLDTSSTTVRPIRKRSMPVRWPRGRPVAAGASCMSMAVSSVASVTPVTPEHRSPGEEPLRPPDTLLRPPAADCDWPLSAGAAHLEPKAAPGASVAMLAAANAAPAYRPAAGTSGILWTIPVGTLFMTLSVEGDIIGLETFYKKWVGQPSRGLSALWASGPPCLGGPPPMV